MTIESRFEYNIREAVKEYLRQFDSVKEAVVDFRRNKHTLASVLLDRAETWNGDMIEFMQEVGAEVGKAKEKANVP